MHGLMVLGHKRHGKDTVSEMICRKFGLTFESSSAFVAEKAVRPALAAQGIVYATYDEMYADRGNHRPAWKKAISEYNTPDKARLGRELYEIHDIYCGIRCKDELAALRAAGIVKYTIWVDASRRLPPEDDDSCTVTMGMADYVLDNNGPEHLLDGLVDDAMAAAIEAVHGVYT